MHLSHTTSINYTVTPTTPVNDNEIPIQRNATPTMPAEDGYEISMQQRRPPFLGISRNQSALNGVVVIFEEIASPSVATLLAIIDHLLRQIVVWTNHSSSDHCPQLRFFRSVEYQTLGRYLHNHICIGIPSNNTSSVLNVYFQKYVMKKNRDEQ